MTDANTRIDDYLLGQLSEEERGAFEREYFADAATFEHLVRAETDLIDQYVRGRMTPDQRARFEGTYLRHPRRLERVRFAEAFAAEIDHLDTAGSSARPDRADGRAWMVWLAVAASILFAAAIGALWLRNGSLRREIAAAETARSNSERQLQQQLDAERARTDALRRELDRTNAPPTESTSSGSSRPAGPLVVSLLLRAPSEREAQAGPPATLTIPPSAQTVRLDLAVERLDYRTFHLFVQRAGGGEVFALHNAAPRQSSTGDLFTAAVAADHLPNGDYILTLRGQTAGGEIDDISRTLFRIVRPAGSANR